MADISANYVLPNKKAAEKYKKQFLCSYGYGYFPSVSIVPEKPNQKRGKWIVRTSRASSCD